jgi:TRAP-type transport system periplasmic protein
MKTILRHFLQILIFVLILPFNASAQTVEWRYITILPKGQIYEVPVDAAFQRIKERTKGKLSIKVFYGGELPYKSPEFLRVLSEGKVDMAFIANQALEGMPMAAASSLPYLSRNGTFDEQIAISNAVDKQVRDDIEKRFHAQVLGRFWWPPQILFTNKPVKNIGDVKNLKVRAVGRELTEAMSVLNVSSVGIDSTEVYSALGRGTVDGAITGASNFLDYKMYEVAKYAYTEPINYVENSIAVSDKAWNGIPKDTQNIVSEELGKACQELTDISKNDEKSLKVLSTQHGVTVFAPPPGEREQIRAKVLPVWQRWADRNGSEGKEALAALYKITGGEPK